MRPFVLDASVALAWCIPDEQNERTQQLLRRCEDGYVLVPALWPTEIANGLLVAERRRRIESSLLSEFLQRVEQLNIRIESASVSQALVIELARREHLTVYDASYLDLARRRSLPLATLDTALAKAAGALGVTVL